MPGLPNGFSTRRLVILVVAFSCAAGAAQERRAGRSKKTKRPSRPPASQPTAESLPAPPTQPADPALETITEARHRLTRTPADRRTRVDHALLASLNFTLAVAQADGAKAALLIDAVGYQALPVDGDLPDVAARPLSAESLAAQISARAPVDFGGLRLQQHVQLLRREQVRTLFPAVATWMLPDQDFAVVVQPDAALGPHWLNEPACLVVRLRATRATIVGGNLLAQLNGWQATAEHPSPRAAPPPESPPPPDGEDK